VAASSDDQFKPRVLLEIPGRPGELLVTDLGRSWGVERGRVWYLDARDPDAVVLKPVLDGLTTPHPLTVGPDGWIYLAEDTRIRAFPPDAVGASGELDASRIEEVLGDLPPREVNGEVASDHPIRPFAFDAAGNLFVGVGAYSDHCAAFAGRACQEADPRRGGASADPRDWGAVLRRYDRIGERAFDADYAIVAMGLRNTVGLAFAANGDLLLAEAGRDFAEDDRPFDEINLIPRAELRGEAPAKHHGWPYCYDAYETSEEWKGYAGFACSADNPDYRPPYLLLPPHGTPLGLAYYRGDRFPQLAGRLLVALHGYRPTGQRVLAFEVDGDGLPRRSGSASHLVSPTEGAAFRWRPYPVDGHASFAGRASHLVSAWFAVDGVRPRGAPVAPYVASDGSIWIADDANGVLLRFDVAD
jgi:glucose/arabinose dehydrogenase